MIRKISVDINTSFAQGAGTNGQVYLGIGGREFRLDIADHEDFEAGDEMTYEFGDDANVMFPDRNDPRRGVIMTRAIIRTLPVYIRFQPRDGSDDWNLANVRVRVLGETGTALYSALDGNSEHVWLGPQSGLLLHLQLRES